MFAGSSTVLPAESVNETAALCDAVRVDALADAAELLAAALEVLVDVEELPAETAELEEELAHATSPHMTTAQSATPKTASANPLFAFMLLTM